MALNGLPHACLGGCVEWTAQNAEQVNLWAIDMQHEQDVKHAALHEL